MTIARIFQSGNSQAIRLPKDFRFDVNHLEIFRRCDEVVLRPVPTSAAAVFNALALLPDDLMPDGRYVTPPQERDEI